MEFRLESSVLEEKKIVKTFSRNFRSEAFSEETLILDKAEISGSIRHIQLDGFCLIIKDLQVPFGYSMNISSNSSIFKLHFELEGGYSYTPANGTGPIMIIPEGHFNIFYFAKIEGTLRYKPTSRKTLEVLFTEDFLLKAAGGNFRETFRDLSDDMNKKRSFLFWKESRPILPELQQNIREIIGCQYCSHIKKIYLEARITTLLLNFLVNNSNQTSPPEQEQLSKSEYTGIQKVEAHIRQHFREGITIGELAPIAGLNTSKLKQSFKKVHSTTIFKFITRLRMEMAKELISKEKRSVSETAYEVGYKNPQHFTVAFKKYYGFLPSSISAAK